MPPTGRLSPLQLRSTTGVGVGSTVVAVRPAKSCRGCMNARYQQRASAYISAARAIAMERSRELLSSVEVAVVLANGQGRAGGCRRVGTPQQSRATAQLLSSLETVEGLFQSTPTGYRRGREVVNSKSVSPESQEECFEVVVMFGVGNDGSRPGRPELPRGHEQKRILVPVLSGDGSAEDTQQQAVHVVAFGKIGRPSPCGYEEVVSTCVFRQCRAPCAAVFWPIHVRSAGRSRKCFEVKSTAGEWGRMNPSANSQGGTGGGRESANIQCVSGKILPEYPLFGNRVSGASPPCSFSCHKETHNQ